MIQIFRILFHFDNTSIYGTDKTFDLTCQIFYFLCDNSKTFSLLSCTRRLNWRIQCEQEITKVLDDSREKLADVNGSLEREKAEYDTVCLHIERANDLGTQKSTMFENMENLLVQIAPIAKELERKNWWHYFTKTDWQKNNIVYIYISGIF